MSRSGTILISACVLVALWDMIAADAGVDYTVSRFVQRTGAMHPSLILAIGVLIGHFFAAMKVPSP